MDSERFERFSAYKFAMDYPVVCRIEFNPKSRRQAGDVVFHFPDREKIFLSWGDLEKALKKFPTAEQQAEHSLQNVKKDSHAKRVEKIRQDSLEINSHKAFYNHVKIDEIPATLFPGKKTRERQAFTMHLHCEPTSRYFVIYSLLSPNAPEDFGDLFLEMSHSFKCH